MLFRHLHSKAVQRSPLSSKKYWMALQVILSRILTAGAIHKEKLKDAGDWEDGGKNSRGIWFEQRECKEEEEEEG